MTHLTEEDLVLLYYREPGAPRNGEAHLAECPDCRAAAESLSQTLSLCDEIAVPERPADFGRDVWNQLVPQLEIQRDRRRIFPIPVWAGTAALAILLITVFMAGRFSRPAQPPVMAGLSDHARQRILAIAVADHLDRVQMLLTEIADGSADPTALASERARAGDLVEEGRLMRQSLAAQGENSTTVFLDEVERFLIEAAHTPDGASVQEVRDLRDRIESGSLLFKVRIVESNLRNEEQKL